VDESFQGAHAEASAVQIDVDEIARRAGWSDPHWRFRAFCCPACRCAYLYEEEYGEVWLDPDHLERTVCISGLESFPCEACGKIVLYQPFGSSSAEIQPAADDLARWAWALSHP